MDGTEKWGQVLGMNRKVEGQVFKTVKHKNVSWLKNYNNVIPLLVRKFILKLRIKHSFGLPYCSKWG